MPSPSPLATEEHGREPASAAACERELKLKLAMVTGGGQGRE